MECGLSALRLLVRKRPFRTPFPRRAAARHGGSDGGLDLLQGTTQASAGARKASGPQAIGVTRGGLNTKIHALCDALGNPLRFLLTPGQRHDAKAVPELLNGVMAKALLADKAYDSDKIIQSAQEQGMQVIIPSKANRKTQRTLDKERYKARHLVEHLFQRMKVFRRVATRFDKLDSRYLGFVYIAGTMKWLH